MNRIISCPKPERAGTVLAFCAGSIGPSVVGRIKELSKGLGTVDHQSSLRHAPFWCMGAALTVQRWYSTSRSAGECIQRQSSFPGWLPGLNHWY